MVIDFWSSPPFFRSCDVGVALLLGQVFGDELLLRGKRVGDPPGAGGHQQRVALPRHQPG